MSAATFASAQPAASAAVVRRSKLATGVLGGASLIALSVGVAAFAAPIPFYEQYGIELAGDASALNETRAAGAAVLAVGALIGVGAIRPRWAFASAVAGGTVFLAYGLARLFSAAVDGAPATGLITAAVVEVAVGAVCVFVALRLRRNGAIAR